MASVRRHCVDKVLAWPGEIHHQTSYAAERVGGSVTQLLEKAAKYDPFQTWKQYEELIAGYKSDLFAIRDAVQPASGESGHHGTPTPPVVLKGPGNPVLVNGKEQPALTAPQYNVLQALLETGDRGLNKDELVRKSGHADAVNILKRLAQKNDEWTAVIGLAGTTGGRYRIK